MYICLMCGKEIWHAIQMSVMYRFNRNIFDGVGEKASIL